MVNVSCETKTVSKIVHEEEKLYSINNLTEEDMQVLISILWRIGGDPCKSYRTITDKIGKSILKHEELNPRRLDTCDYTSWWKKIHDTIDVNARTIHFKNIKIKN